MRSLGILVILAAVSYATPALPCGVVVSNGSYVLAGPPAVGFGVGWRRRQAGVFVGSVALPCPAAAVYVAPPPVYAVAAPVVAMPPPVPAPVYYYAPPPAPPPPTVVVPAPPQPVVERIPRLAIKWAPVGTSMLFVPSWTERNFALNAGSFGLEYRFGNGYFAIRSDFEYGKTGKVWDIAQLKLSLFKHSFIRPFASGGVGAAEVYDHNADGSVAKTTQGVAAVAAVGLDLFIGRHFFLEAEAKYRFFPNVLAGIGPEGANLSQVSAVAGAGVAFF